MSQEGTGKGVNYVDINNLEFADEVIEGFDPTVNQYDAPPPPKPGLYTAVLSFSSEDPTRRWRTMEYKAEKYPQKAGQTYLVTELTGRIVEPGNEFDGRRVRDRFVSTGIFNKPTSAVASLIHLFGRGDELTSGISTRDLIQLFEACLAGEPQVKVRTDWEWRGQKADDGTYPQVRGFKNFPEVNGQVSHLIEDPNTGEKIPGFGVIVGYRAA